MNLALKATPLSKRIRELEKELSRVDGNLRNLAKVVDGTRPAPTSMRLPPLVDPAVEDRSAAERIPPPPLARETPRPARDSRFGDYLSASIERPSVPLRHERSVQRNKAIVMLCLVVLVLFWVLHRWLV